MCVSEGRNTDVWVRPQNVFDDGRLIDGVAVAIAQGTISAVVPFDEVPTSAPVHDFDGILAPGFVDLQVNGGGGALLNDRPTKETMFTIARAHRAFGTTALLPTVITDSPEVLDLAVEAVIDAMGQNGVQGLHIEGPHISVDQRGTHKAEFVRALDHRTIDQIARLRAVDIPVLITLAPDVVAPEDIRRIADLGAVVSIGHSMASAEIARQALDAGATCFTHLFNAMPPMAGRKPGVAGAAINSGAYVGIICDGVHVEDEMVGMAIRARPRPDRMFLVSDAMPTVGGPSEFDLYGTKVRLVNNRLVNSEGSLAGAHTTQGHSVKRLVESVGISPEDALRMAITIPGNVMGLSLDRLQGTGTGNVLCLEDDMSFGGYLDGFLARDGSG